MRWTPFLDERSIRVTEPKGLTDPQQAAFDHLINVIDSALSFIEGQINWGEWEGRRRKPCVEQPVLLAGKPIGQYHCPQCGMMLMAGWPHFSPSAPSEQDPQYPAYDYEVEYGQLWPPGYEGDDVGT